MTLRPDTHPAEINGVTDEYQRFLKTWASHCGAPRAVFQGNLNLVVQAELRAAGQDVVAYAEELMAKQETRRRALDDLTARLVVFLGAHDCCSDAALLLDRVTRARVVLRLDTPEGGA